MNNQWKTVICLLIAFILPTSVFSATNESPKKTTRPSEVYIGIYANQLLGMSIKDNTFDIDYYMWLRWKNPNIKPHKNLELLNGRESCQLISELKKNDWNYVTLRCVSKITNFWDLSRFPLDNQKLELVFEDNYSDSDHLIYIPDRPSSNISKTFHASGWKIDGISLKTTTGEYESNFGDPTLPDRYNSEYSRFVYGINLVRSFYDTEYAFKLFLPVFIAMIISLLQFFVPVDAAFRFNLGVGAIFASVGASYAITNSLPPSSYMSIAELINLITILYILFCLCGSVYSLNIFKKHADICISKKFDARFVVFVATLYIVSVLLVIIFK